MFTLALDRYDHYVSHILTCFYRFNVFNLYFIQEYCVNFMDFKISDTNSGKHNCYSYRIDVVL